ncbi:MAG: hypothetical protein EP346_07900 [Bacteroidetes bacterium]|nr:MAG: hypothetical protein EP346_07900 [Bacteroidota bacterium]
MAHGKMDVYVVDVGQGQSTFVAIYDSSNTKITNTLLFDCGSDKGSSEVYINLDTIAAMVLSMDKPIIDCMVFSHSDKDHISLTKYLLDKINETKKPLVKKVWYGGCWDNYTKYGFNILDYMSEEGFCDMLNIDKTCGNFTNYSKTTDAYVGSLWKTSSEQIAIFAIASNVISDDPDWDEDEDVGTQSNAEEKNRVSIVCALYYGDTCFVICGDATNKTMAAIGGLMTGSSKFSNNIMTTLPHHGSRATGFAVKSSDAASSGAIAVVDTFAACVKSKTITISAYEKHHHPSLELINHFIPTVTTPIIRDPRLNEANSHRVTAYFDQDLTNSSGMTLVPRQVYSFETRINTFSTRYFDGYGTVSYQIGTSQVNASSGVDSSVMAINGFASWLFSVPSASDQAFIYGMANMSSAPFTAAATSGVAAPQLQDKQPVPKVRIRRKEVRPYRTLETRNSNQRVMQFQH